jgi:XTP/dITP diphosphohydrolase
MHLLLASRNQGKILEITRLLQTLDQNLQVLGLDSFPAIGDIPETGASFEENALIKARAAAEGTGLISLADDSGLEVDALSGAPGIHSARYSGEGASDRANNDKLLEAMLGLPEARRTARFRCVMAVYAPNGEHFLAQGTWEGSIAERPRGSHGFGYDPLFLDPETGLTAAEMDQASKNARSHRGRALRDLLDKLPAFLAGRGKAQPAASSQSTEGKG